MDQDLHTILGPSGGVGRAVLFELQQRNLNFRAVERTSKIKDIDTFKADLLIKEEASKAISGSDYVYVCVGLPYQKKFWRDNWPILIDNVIAACEDNNSVLVFLDNIYMYGPPPLSVPFDESHPQNPSSHKGATRKIVADKVMAAIDQGKIKGLIARAPDFFGLHSANSLLYISFLERMLKGKAPMSLSKTGIQHTYGNTKDIGKAMVELALDPSTYGQVWHTPVGEPMTVEEAASIMNKELGTNFKLSYLTPFMRKILSLFIPALKEVEEMIYQSENDYIMSHEKFISHFPNFKISTNEEGIRDMIASFKNENR